jgi:hypothetical protein
MPPEDLLAWTVARELAKDVEQPDHERAAAPEARTAAVPTTLRAVSGPR